MYLFPYVNDRGDIIFVHTPQGARNSNGLHKLVNKTASLFIFTAGTIALLHKEYLAASRKRLITFIENIP